MRQDVEANKPLEIDALVGAVRELGQITGTPTLVFADGSRVPGAINAQQVEKFLAEAK